MDISLIAQGLGDGVHVAGKVGSAFYGIASYSMLFSNSGCRIFKRPILGYLIFLARAPRLNAGRCFNSAILTELIFPTLMWCLSVWCDILNLTPHAANRRHILNQLPLLNRLGLHPVLVAFRRAARLRN